MRLIRNALRYSGSPRLLLGVTVALVGVFAATTADARCGGATEDHVGLPPVVCLFALPNNAGLVNLLAVGSVYVNKNFEFGKMDVYFGGVGTTLGRVTLPEADVPKLFEAVQAVANKCRGSLD